MIVPKLEEKPDLVEFEDQHGDGESNEKSTFDYAKKLLGEILRLLSKVTDASIGLVKKVLQYKPMKIFIMLPWTIISNLPVFGIMRQPVEYLIFPMDKEGKAENGNSSSNNLIGKPPLMEEISIPSVTELSKSGFCFLPTNGGISTIGLDVNTELLREKGIILSHLKSDEEVASMWNGMSKSIRLTKVPFLDKVIEEVNKYYNGRFSLKVWKFMKFYVFVSWQFLTFFCCHLALALDVLASLLLILQVQAQVFLNTR
ncbi:hypothetical protein L6164_007622 [Bauhinia variegata]|uniref:Uncharacterized protein n=1 Tax=Bauhinia variegata TaxID=167791 RepID=A0ACB9PD76_BAUVA|nr:hypothetical protein L6164_007622 [Bauhinia variegata]